MPTEHEQRYRRVQAALRDHDIDVLLAVDEAATNVVVHGYQGREGVIEIEVLREGDALVIRLRDEAEPFDPTSLPPPDLAVPLAEHGRPA